MSLTTSLTTSPAQPTQPTDSPMPTFARRRSSASQRMSPGMFAIDLGEEEHVDAAAPESYSSHSESASHSLSTCSGTTPSPSTAIGTPTAKATEWPEATGETPPALQLATPHGSHPSFQTATAQTDATDKPQVLESITDLVSRVEAWRGGMSCSGPTSLKRNKAYVGLWALGVQDLLSNPVLVTAMSSPACSHFEPPSRR